MTASNFRNVGRGHSSASHYHCLTNQAGALADKNAEGPITKREYNKPCRALLKLYQRLYCFLDISHGTRDCFNDQVRQQKCAKTRRNEQQSVKKCRVTHLVVGAAYLDARGSHQEQDGPLGRLALQENNKKKRRRLLGN